jgi:hypothetical protein
VPRGNLGRPSVPLGREVWTSRMGVTGSGGQTPRDFLPTTGYPEVPAGEQESGKVINHWNPKQGRTTLDGSARNESVCL